DQPRRRSGLPRRAAHEPGPDEHGRVGGESRALPGPRARRARPRNPGAREAAWVADEGGAASGARRLRAPNDPHPAEDGIPRPRRTPAPSRGPARPRGIRSPGRRPPPPPPPARRPAPACGGATARVRLRGGRRRAGLRAAPPDCVPGPIPTGRKMDSPVPVGRWLRAEFWPIVEEFVLGPRALARGLFRPAALRRLAEEHRAGAERHGDRLWLLANLEIWQRIFLDGEDPADIGRRP